MRGAILILAILLLPWQADAQRRVRVVNVDADLADDFVKSELREALRIIRRETGVRMRIESYRRSTDRSPADLDRWARVRWFRGTTGARKRTTTIIIYRTREFGFGYADICSRSPIITIAYPNSDAPIDWLRLVLAHEIGHTLGAQHDDVPQSTLAEYSHAPLGIMFPDWWLWFVKFERGLAGFHFTVKSRVEIMACGRAPGSITNSK